MKLTTFLKRPVLSGVVSVLIVMLGIMGFLSLPIEQYPDIAPPTVEVNTNFYGADAQTIINSVITPLEDAINGVENMIYMNSTASNNGEATINVVFKQGTNPDMAAVNVQNRVQRATALLPAEVKQVGVTVEKRQNSMLQIFSIYSPDDTYDFKFLSNFASINVKPRIMLVNGVGKFQMLGSDYSLRVWMDPASMAQHNLTPDDVAAALQTQNIEAATGTFGENSDESYQYKLKYTGRLKELSEFENIVIRSESNGDVLRLKDVARVELGSELYSFNGTTNGHPGVMCIAYQAAGSNATQVNKEIKEALELIKKEAPSGIEIATLLDTNEFLYASIKQVAETLRDAIILVILIVLLFLKDFRSTLIPFISIMVSLIGTFAFMMVVGFSINLLTLFALVLVIGTVVDDSIVVVEAVHAKFEEGILDPYKATKEAIGEVAAPVITSSLVFMAVFIPVSMLGGTSGIFYRQFGLTMAVAVGISAINALTTVPALCSLLLKPIEKPEEGKKLTFKQKYSQWFDAKMAKFTGSYGNGLQKTTHFKPVIWAVMIGALVLLVFCMKTMPKGLVPDEDKGLLITEISAPPGTSLSSTDAIASQISNEIRQLEGMAEVSTTSGYGFISGANSASACIICRLKNWDERDKEHTQNKIAGNIQALCSKYKDVNAMVFTTPMIPGYGTSSGIEMYVQDRRGRSVGELFEVTNDYLVQLAQEGVYGFMTFNMDYPQWEVSVDVAKCIRNGVSPKEVLSTMGAYYGGAYVNDLNLYSKVYKVMIMGNPDSRRDESCIDRTYVRTAQGGMAPLSNFISIKRVYGPDAIKTFNKFTAIVLSVASEKSTGETLDIVKKVAESNLPEGYSIDFAGMSREQNNQGGLEVMLLICTFLIYLILAALYESVVIPFAAILAVPVGLAGSYFISRCFGLDNNIYLQTGVIMLIGLLSKTAILITEYAVLRHKKGLSADEAAVEAGKARLRPILMTAGTMIIGLLPLITSINGVGGMGNFSLGLGTIIGMTIGTVALLFVTPVTYTTFQKIQDKIKPQKEDDDDED